MAYNGNKKIRINDLKKLTQKHKLSLDEILTTIGTLSALNTSNKTSIINAINEIVDMATMLDARTEILGSMNASMKNALYRGANLGDFTAAHLAAIKNGTFKDLWLGDYWRDSSTGRVYRILHFDYFNYTYDADGTQHILGDNTGQHHVVISATGGSTPFLANKNGDPRYTTSKWYTKARPQYLQDLKDYFGEENCLQWRAVENIYDNANKKAVGEAAFYGQLELPTEGMMFGFNADRAAQRATSTQYMCFEHRQLAAVAFGLVCPMPSRDPFYQTLPNFTGWSVHNVYDNTHVYSSSVAADTLGKTCVACIGG